MSQKHPLVFGMRELWPGQLARVEMHQTRTGGDLSHIRPGRTHLNQFLIGDPDWREKLEEDIRRAKELNLRHAYHARRYGRKRKGEAAKLRRAGPVDPWKRDRSEGPLREGVLTANRKHFDGDTPGFPSVEKEDRFRSAALKFLRDQFGASCVAAWEDRDEEAYHIHFVVAPWVVSESKQAGKQRRLEPSSIPVVKNYEAGHDIAAEYYAGAGLVRGEKRAQARREAYATEGESELPAANVPCHEWRADEAIRLHEERKKAARAWVAARAKEAAARATEQRAADASERNRLDQERREKKFAARLAAIETRECQVVEKEAEMHVREAILEEGENDLKRRVGLFVSELKSYFDLGEKVRSAARAVGLLDHPLVQTAAEAIDRLRGMSDPWDPQQRRR